MHLETLIPFAALLGLFGLFVVRFLYEWIYGFSDRTSQDLIPYLQKIDLSEVRSLFDPQDERYFQLNVSLREFKRIQWKRCRLAQQYVRNLAHNARVIQEWGRFERNRSRKTLDSGVRRASLELTIVCAQCRICAVILQLQLHWWLLKMSILPFTAPPSFRFLLRLGSMEILSFYEKIRNKAGEIGESYGENYKARLAQVI
ncbi:MAG TPA: hypothetical protein VNW97_06195 [Candidatus Saccharimonadales bacterium]|jgi:hypothetical protein|nr:hypothetical protein [Candidatus Saccharimonadales bacterium]